MGLLIQVARTPGIQLESVEDHPLASLGEGDADEDDASPFLQTPPHSQEEEIAQDDWVMVDFSEPHGQDLDPNIHVAPYLNAPDILNGAFCGIPNMLNRLGAHSKTSSDEGSGRVNQISNDRGGMRPDPLQQGMDVVNTSQSSASSPGAASPSVQSIPVDLSMDDIVYSHPKIIIGHGAFGKVFKAHYNGNDVAVKQIGREFSSPKEIKSIVDELKILSRLGQHEKLVRCFGGCMTPPDVFIVEELMECDLHKLIHPDGAGLGDGVPPHPLPLRQILKVGLDIAHGLLYMHPNYIHKDLKPQNILMKDGDYKIADFGLSKAKKDAYISRSMSRSVVGTILYMAPEAFDGKDTPLSDIYSLGVILWECVTGKMPYEEFLEHNRHVFPVMYNVVGRNMRPSFPEDVFCPQDLRQLIYDCWDREPSNRPGCEEIINRLHSIRQTSYGSWKQCPL